MIPLSHLLPSLPGFTAPVTIHAPWPVWSGSTASPVHFHPTSAGINARQADRREKERACRLSEGVKPRMKAVRPAASAEKRKAQQAAYGVVYRAVNADKIKARKHAYYLANRERLLAEQKVRDAARSAARKAGRKEEGGA